MAFPLVAIGASAGGLEALCELLMAVPPKGAAAYVVIQHLDPERKSLLPELLTKKTALPVRLITDGLTVEPAHVYVMPPNTTLTLNGGRFQLVPRERGRRHHPVDGFFVSLAQARGDAAIGVVLSGAGADGSRGVQAIKYSEGITFAQTPRSAPPWRAPPTRIAPRIKPARDQRCLDLLMHGMDGFEVGRRIRKAQWGKDIAIIALTGWRLEEHRRRDSMPT